MQRGWLIAAILIGLAAIVIAAVVMRLGDDGPPTAEAWADEVCSSVSDWRDSIASLADAGDEPITADTLRDRLDEAGSATSELVTELRELGPPDLEAGDDLEAVLDDATAQLESSVDELRETGEAAADAPAGQLPGNLAALASAFTALQSTIGDSVATLHSANAAEESRAELEQAFADASSCQSLQVQG